MSECGVLLIIYILNKYIFYRQDLSNPLKNHPIDLKIVIMNPFIRLEDLILEFFFL